MDVKEPAHGARAESAQSLEGGGRGQVQVQGHVQVPETRVVNMGCGWVRQWTRVGWHS